MESVKKSKCRRNDRLCFGDVTRFKNRMDPSTTEEPGGEL